MFDTHKKNKALFMTETIFAPLAPIAKSAVSIVRLSGPNSLFILREITKRQNFLPRRAYLQKLFEPQTNDVFDQALVIYFNGPNSFTGEDVVELYLHGSPAIIRLCLKILGAFPETRMADPGEFSKRAFDNGKMDLTEAEGLADLIASETSLQAKQALKQMNGHLKNLYENWRSDLVNIMAEVEAYIDFPDEDLPLDLQLKFRTKIDNLITKIKYHLNDKHKGEILRNGIKVGIIGEPNVGKSTLLNYLCQRSAAIVSDLPGTTRDIIEITIDIEGYPFIIADTAGIRESDNLVEQEGIKRALAYKNEADITLAVFESKDLSEENIIKANLDLEKTLIIANKYDLPSKGPKTQDLIQKYNIIPISALSGHGVAKIIENLVKKAENLVEVGNDPIITNDRQRQLLEQSLSQLLQFSLTDPIEITSENLRMAANFLGKITGRISVEDILDRLFSNFCIGK